MSKPARPDEPATLELRDVTIRRAGSALLTSVSVRLDAERVGLVGDWQPLFEALTGHAQVAAGSAQFDASFRVHNSANRPAIAM